MLNVLRIKPVFTVEVGRPVEDGHPLALPSSAPDSSTSSPAVRWKAVTGSPTALTLVGGGLERSRLYSSHWSGRSASDHAVVNRLRVISLPATASIMTRIRALVLR